MRPTADDRRTLEAGDWFAALPVERRELILGEASVSAVPDGARLYGAGDPPNGLWAVLEGQVRLIGYPASGMEILVRILGPGVWFGELSTLDGGPRPHDAVAFGSASVLHLSPASVARLGVQDGAFYRDLGLLVCANQRTALAFIEQRAAQPVAVRLARALAKAADEAGSPSPLSIRQAELASVVGVSRQTLNRGLRRLEEAGVVALGYASIAILDPARLSRLCNPEAFGR
ncbi:Crp/Fnr family transcriptional regulator [Caulobacter soli]|uniref:Crp/Fnr family transcriptional regulator n=1 Tax=Caulobacter soli TaxID=2708539 RepID=UPI0013ECAB19|nr:Crp/Fnr family transcriptional regulator [Caulobacter soli]